MIRATALVSLVASLASITGAAAAPSPVARAFGNTLVSTYPDGRTAELWLQSDGAYTAKGRRGDGSGGRWKIDGQKLCLKQSRPFPSPFSFCTPIPQGGLGTTWSAKAVTGEPIQVRLARGRFEGVAKSSG